ncbi:MAG: hypothetical protein JWM21_3513 [Acidobacteria bacterium]|nr:hypothetical protein [Acidobacteriota bacterium]
MSISEEKANGKRLNDEWKVGAKHALYSEEGTWYHKLTEFPGAFFDANGYVVFDSESDYRNCENLQIGKQVNVPDGISSIPGYVYARRDQLDDENDVEYGKTGSIYPYDMPEEVDITEEPQTVFEWMRKIEQKRLIIDPEFQRNRVWKPKQKSQFIESVLLNIPLPPLYVNKRKDGRFIIVDGLQRTATLEEYTKLKSFALSDLEVLKGLNGLRFDQLDTSLQAKIEDKKFFLFVIKPSVPLPMVYDIFHRINTGGTQLSRQEIRNCFYIGPATRLLKEVAEKKYFRLAIDNGISPRRMKDREAVLRCLAFKIFDYRTDYKNDMDAFLGEALTRMNLMDNGLPELVNEFERVMTVTYEFWGENNFRLPTTKGRGRINIALMESVFFFFTTQSDRELRQNKSSILQNYEKLLKNSDYLEAIQFSTGDTRRVKRRFELAETTLGSY